LSLYALILDFIFGSILFLSFLTVPSVKRILESLKGTRHLKKYTTKARIGFLSWAAFLLILIVLVSVEKFEPAVYKTTHIALIMNNFNQLINTLQFYAAFQLLIAVDFLMKLGSRRKRIRTFARSEDVASRSDPASDADPSTPSMREMFRMEDPLSDDPLSSGLDE
jgi:hypothetical protein